MVEPRTEEDPPVPVAAAPAPSRAPVALATLAFVIAAASLAGMLRIMMVNDKLESRLAVLETAEGGESTATRVRDLGNQVARLGAAVTALTDEEVDLLNSKLQHLRYGFAVSELALSRKDNGVVVSGRLINASSVTHREVTFRIKAGNSSGEFAVANLQPGTSGAFEVTLPNVPLENARNARFSMVSSAVVFAH